MTASSLHVPDSWAIGAFNCCKSLALGWVPLSLFTSLEMAPWMSLWSGPSLVPGARGQVLLAMGHPLRDMAAVVQRPVVLLEGLAGPWASPFPDSGLWIT